MSDKNNLRESVKNCLQSILPADPSQAIKGTVLIRLLRMNLKLGDEYSDATLRYHLSILSYDMTSRIAKVDQGQGYYLRSPKSANREYGVGTPGLFEESREQADLLQDRLKKGKLIYKRYLERNAHDVYFLPEQEELESSVDGSWEMADLISVSREGNEVSEVWKQLKRAVGEQLSKVTAIQFCQSVDPEDYLENFYKALSATCWANRSVMVILEALEDEALVEILRKLSMRFGVDIVSLGLSLEAVDQLPEANSLAALDESRFDAVMARLNMNVLAYAAERPQMDLEWLTRLNQKFVEMNEVVEWLAKRC
jgi:hypothetical protein